MKFLTDRQTEKMKLWLKIKPPMIFIAILLIAFENLAGVRDFFGHLPAYIALIVALVLGLAMRDFMKKGKMWLPLAHASFLIDSTVILAAVYSHGSLETPWAFGPVFVTFMGAYVFGIGYGMAYAAFACCSFLGVFLLEIYRIIPHIPIFGIPDLYWTHTGYFVNFLVGFFMMNFTLAFAIGSLGKLIDQRNEKIERYVQELEGSGAKIQNVEREAGVVADAVLKKNAEVERNREIIADRESEIAETKKEIERLMKEKGK
jgi:hypothetical protein